jgi:hypothetical protein
VGQSHARAITLNAIRRSVRRRTPLTETFHDSLSHFFTAFVAALCMLSGCSHMSWLDRPDADVHGDGDSHWDLRHLR